MPCIKGINRGDKWLRFHAQKKFKPKANPSATVIGNVDPTLPNFLLQFFMFLCIIYIGNMVVFFPGKSQFFCSPIIIFKNH